MRINYAGQRGVSLLELIAFIVIVSIATAALFKAYNFSVMHSVDPLAQVRALELAQAKLDEILALKYDENTPTGGIPACGSFGAIACSNTPDANMNDVDDYNNYSDTPYTVVVSGTTYSYTRSVTVSTANNQKLVTVTVSTPQGVSITLAAYRSNF